MKKGHKTKLMINLTDKVKQDKKQTGPENVEIKRSQPLLKITNLKF